MGEKENEICAIKSWQTPKLGIAQMICNASQKARTTTFIGMLCELYEDQ